MEPIKIKTSRITKKVLWQIYAFAFVVLIGTITTSHYIADWTVKKQEQYASVINISGRQRMLSQRITGLLSKALLTSNLSERNLRILVVDQAIALMDESHQLLTDTNQEIMTPAIRAIYFAPDSKLDSQVKTYLSEARRLRDLATAGEAVDPADIKHFADQGFGPLLKQLDKAVIQYQYDSQIKLNSLRQLNIGLWLFTIVVICLELLFIFRPLARRLDETQKKLEDIGHTDPLTGCWNRRALMSSGDMMWSLARRQGRSLSVIICDIDKFKRINDTYGHLIGDEAIKAFVQTCLEELRQYDLFGRVGGEEFIIILPDTDTSLATTVAERIRKTQELKTVETDGLSLKMTASFGVAEIGPEDKTLQSLIDLADQALYSAKENGRNRVEVFTR